MTPFIAYVDPGTGATITQLLLAGSVGVAAVVKLRWHSIKSFFSRSDSVADAQATVDEEDTVDHR